MANIATTDQASQNPLTAQNVFGALTPKNLSALRLIRGGGDPHDVSKRYRTPIQNLVHLEKVFKNVPDRILSGVGYLVNDNLKLQRLLHALERLPQDSRKKNSEI